MSHNQDSIKVLAAVLAGLVGLQSPISMAGLPTSVHPLTDALAGNQTHVVESAQVSDMTRLIERLADRRLIFVGESHDRYEDHLNQLAVIQGLVDQGKTVAIGMEFFQQPYQKHLDAYVAGRIDETELLRKTQYFERWRYDFRLYRPILRYARNRGLPLIALNPPAEVTGRVGEVGIAGLDERERRWVPAEIDRADADYRERLRRVFEHHPASEQRNFEHFLEVQLLWDEGMAERAAAYLKANPEKTLVVLAGFGHLESGQGIPKRLLRRVQVPSAILLSGNGRTLDPSVADYFLYPPAVELPASGLLGIRLDEADSEQGVRVAGFGDGSGAKAAGMEEGDRILRIGEQSIASYGDIRIALLDAKPGDQLSVEVLRKRLVGGDQRLNLQVELH